MAKNNKHWEKMMLSDSDRSAVSEGKDPLEMGLSDMTWFEKQKRKVRRTIEKTRETFGEEVGNSITSGVLALYMLFMLPYATVHSYVNAPENMALVDSFAVSAFFVFAFLASLFTTIYHFLKPNTLHKRIALKLDRIMVYFAIVGAYTPFCLSLVGGAMGITLLSIELGLAILGMFLVIFMYPRNKVGSKFAVTIYGLMGLLFLIAIKSFIPYFTSAPVMSWLLVAGLIVYVIGLFFYNGKFKFSHMVWHLMVVAAQVCHVLAYVYFFRR